MGRTAPLVVPPRRVLPGLPVTMRMLLLGSAVAAAAAPGPAALDLVVLDLVVPDLAGLGPGGGVRLALRPAGGLPGGGGR
ncbi:MAG: hypothetical protein HOV66_14495 [Streptomycetaceae bacterium]|nr:hypothetical protein [Streptomycetaceae bacterium]